MLEGDLAPESIRERVEQFIDVFYAPLTDPDFVAMLRLLIAESVRAPHLIEAWRQDIFLPYLQQEERAAAALAASQADVAQARVNLANTRLATARTLELERQQLVSRADGDNARASVRTAEAQLQAALAGLRSAELQLGEGGADNPQIRQAQAQLEQAQLNLLYATVEAPRDGLVTNLQLAVGQYASAGAQVLTFVDS